MGIRKLFRTNKKGNNAFDNNSQTKQQLQRSDSTTSIDSDTSSSSTSSAISFSDTIEVHEITPLSSLTDHPEELWYQKEEYNQIHTRICRLAKYADICDKREEQPKKKVCTRGLERMMEGTCKHTHNGRKCVLIAQKLKFDNEGMALAYKKVSKDSVVLARERACNDAKAIQVYVGK